jgi:hypothetical protein
VRDYPDFPIGPDVDFFHTFFSGFKYSEGWGAVWAGQHLWQAHFPWTLLTWVRFGLQHNFLSPSATGVHSKSVKTVPSILSKLSTEDS